MNRDLFLSQEALIKRLGPNAHAFTIEIPSIAPPSVQLVPAKEYNGPPIGNSYDVRVYVGKLKKLVDFLGFHFFGPNERMHFERKTMAHRNSKRSVITNVRERNWNERKKDTFFIFHTIICIRNKNPKYLYRIEYFLLIIVRFEACKKRVYFNKFLIKDLKLI